MSVRFIGYVNRVFGFGQRLRTLIDGRIAPQIALSVCVASWILGIIYRLGSLHQLEAELRTRAWQCALGRQQPLPSADTLARTLEQLRSSELWRYNQAVIQQARHNKVWSGGTIGGLMLLAVDGTELYQTKVAERACPNCYIRTLKKGQEQYYERVVAVSLVARQLGVELGLLRVAIWRLPRGPD